MKLNLILILGILSACFSIREMGKYGSLYFYASDTEARMRLSDFSPSETIYLKMTVYYAYFTKSYMIYTLSDSIYNPGFDSTSYKNSESYSSSYGGYYNYQTYYFDFDNRNKKYLYFRPPSFVYSSSYGYDYVYVESTTGLSLAIGAIVGIVIACIIVIAAVTIIVICCRRRRYSSYVAPTTPVVYGPPVVPAYPPPTYY